MVHFFPPSPAPGDVPSSPVQTGLYEGEYVDLGVNRSSPEKLLALLKGMRVKENEDGTLAFLGATWTPVAPLTFQEVDGGDLAVFRTEEGTPGSRVTHLIRGELAYEKLPWYRGTAFHLGLLAGCLLVFLSAALSWPVVSLLQRRGTEKPTRMAQLARWICWTMSATFLGFVVAFVIETWENDVLLCGLTTGAKAILMLPLIGAALAGVTAILAGAAWKGWNTRTGRPYWSLGGRIHYTLVALAGIAFVAFAGYWNLLGF
jgi:hypothetical protein